MSRRRNIGEFYVQFLGVDQRWHRPRVDPFATVEEAAHYIEGVTDYGRVMKIAERMADDEPHWLGTRILAQELADATDSETMLVVESTILERLDVSLDESELGLTRYAVERIEEFVSVQLGRPWTYEDLPTSVVEDEQRA